MPETPAILWLVAAWRPNRPVKAKLENAAARQPIETPTKIFSGEQLVSALEALHRASTAGVRVKLQSGRVMIGYRQEPPAAVVDLLRANESALLTILSAREAAMAALSGASPDDCSDTRWAAAMRGLRRFVDGGWSDKAALLGWTAVELYHLPPLWSRIDLTGAALLIGDRRVIAVTEDSIVIETPSGASLKFRRLGREHLA